jgi:hypothetical protein
MLCSIYRGYVSDINKKLDSIEQSIKELMHKSATAQENGDSENAEKLMLEAEAYYEVKSLIRKDKWYSDGVAFLNEFDKNHPDLASAIYFSDVEGVIEFPVLQEKRAAFEKKMAEFATQRKVKEQENSSDYIKTLEKLLTQRRDAGDFDGISAITKELERYTQTQTFAINTSTTDLSNITKQFIAQEHENMRQIDIALIAFVDKYVSELNKLMSDETRANNIHVAAAIAAERTRVQSLVEIIEIRERLK